MFAYLVICELDKKGGSRPLEAKGASDWEFLKSVQCRIYQIQTKRIWQEFRYI